MEIVGALRALLAACNFRLGITFPGPRQSGADGQGRVVGPRDGGGDVAAVAILATDVANTDMPDSSPHVIFPSPETSTDNPIMSLTCIAVVHKLWQSMACASPGLHVALMARKNVPGRIGDPLTRWSDNQDILASFIEGISCHLTRCRPWWGRLVAAPGTEGIRTVWSGEGITKTVRMDTCDERIGRSVASSAAQRRTACELTPDMPNELQPVTCRPPPCASDKAGPV